MKDSFTTWNGFTVCLLLCLELLYLSTVCESTFRQISTHIVSPSRQLVKSGVLTVRDAGSWWLSIPNSGKFTKYFLQGGCYEKIVSTILCFDEVSCKFLIWQCFWQRLANWRTVCFLTILPLLLLGRKAVLGMVKKSKYSEVLKAELEARRTTSHVKFHMKYHIHDIVGAELVER